MAGNLMEINKFISYCKSGCFIDCDGWGYYSNGDEVFEDKVVYPSDVEEGLDTNYSHVLWFNK